MPEQNLLSSISVLLPPRTVIQQASMKPVTAFTVFRLLVLRRKSFIIDKNYYIQWPLLLFFVIFSASISGSDDSL